jgi:site-specific DNA recombinase
MPPSGVSISVSGMKNEKRAALYLRQSKANDEGIERQRDRTTALAVARGWRIVGTYVDNDVSASKPRGPETAWGRMLAASGSVDVAIAVDLDRIARSTRDLNTLIDHGLALVTVDGEIDLASADGEFRASMLASIARFEARRKGERQRRANEQRASSGRWVGGRRPFGFEPDGVTLREPEAAAVRQGFHDLLSGITLGAIARSWNEQGLTTGQQRQARSGHAGEPSPWTSQNVRLVLTNPRYAGMVRYRGEIQPVSAQWPAIVDEATFSAAQAVLSNPARRSPGRGPSRVLTGLALCGVCGATVHAGQNSRPGIRSYRCSASNGHFARMAEPVESFVEETVIRRLSRPDARELLLAPRASDTTALHVEAVGLRERLDSLAVAFADGSISASQLRSGTDRIRERLSEVDAELADAGRVDVLGELVAADDVRAVWKGYTTDRKRAVIATLMQVTLHPPGRGTRTFRPETVGIEWATAE